MDEIDKKIKWCVDNNACISDDECLKRLSEGINKISECFSCHCAGPKCDECKNHKWFIEHTTDENKE